MKHGNCRYCKRMINTLNSPSLHWSEIEKAEEDPKGWYACRAYCHSCRKWSKCRTGGIKAELRRRDKAQG